MEILWRCSSKGRCITSNKSRGSLTRTGQLNRPFPSKQSSVAASHQPPRGRSSIHESQEMEYKAECDPRSTFGLNTSVSKLSRDRAAESEKLVS